MLRSQAERRSANDAEPSVEGARPKKASGQHITGDLADKALTASNHLTLFQIDMSIAPLDEKAFSELPVSSLRVRYISIDDILW